MVDPSSGTWTFAYNGYAEMFSRTDARQLSSGYQYDSLGRLQVRTWNEPGRNGESSVAYTETTHFNNDSPNAYGSVDRVERQSGTAGSPSYEYFRRQYAYDALGRATDTVTTMQAGNSAEVQRVGQIRRGMPRTVEEMRLVKERAAISLRKCPELEFHVVLRLLGIPTRR